MPEGVFGGRRAARLRAVVNADLLPRERASADALVLTAWLSAAQRARYAPTLRAGGGVEEFAQRLADERRVVLEEGADEVAGELEAAAEAERAARQLPMRLLEGALLLLATLMSALFLILRVATHDPYVPWLVSGVLAWYLVCWFVLPLWVRVRYADRG